MNERFGPTIQPTKPWLGQRSEELGELFAYLPAPAPGELRGLYRGRLLGVPALDRLPRGFRRLAYRLLATNANPWRGKSFGARSGENRWGPLSRFALGRFRVEERASPIDGRVATWLDYDVAANHDLVRSVRGEVRQLREDVYLARMMIQHDTRWRHFAYFTLARECEP